ncbi:hypothetical protein [Bifidobacterium cuniculi]|uniref:Uncharacterized protein n=1 Tax=Bifidobacterium cuniculi TaxID=1688 RepID=A0A087AX45_9BIFI|nr:hypothetical protein [Bifidobacterium cuniculi]KFI63345.1 hypothetical protein BCUN_1313 [Bifidobacterium cuniculi]
MTNSLPAIMPGPGPGFSLNPCSCAPERTTYGDALRMAMRSSADANARLRALHAAMALETWQGRAAELFRTRLATLLAQGDTHDGTALQDGNANLAVLS